MKVTYFRTPLALRRWFKANHATTPELWVGYYKKKTGAASVTWPESVDEALSVGWIDGIRRRIDETRYMVRFTPRRKGSVWSAVNIKRVGELIAEKRMAPEGLRAFEVRKENRSGIYSYRLQADQLVGAEREKEETRLKRLEKLIEASGRGRRV